MTWRAMAGEVPHYNRFIVVHKIVFNLKDETGWGHLSRDKRSLNLVLSMMLAAYLNTYVGPVSQHISE